MTLFVAEFSINHMGNLNVALKMIKKAKEAGADFVKFKKKDVPNFYTKEKLEGFYRSPYGKNFGDYREMFEFGLEDFKRIDKKCKELGMQWFSTAHDEDSLYFFSENFSLPMIKVASIDASRADFLQNVISLYDTVVVSTGGLNLEQIQSICQSFIDTDKKLFLQHCTSIYPCPTNKLFLGNISLLRKEYSNIPNIQIGYSGHEEGYLPTLMAVHLGAQIVERHFCLSRNSFVHHIECSLEPKEFKEMIKKIKGKELGKMMETEFGMKNGEEDFLVHSQYGTNFWKDGKQI